jgi:hypothetical protein
MPSALDQQKAGYIQWLVWLDLASPGGPGGDSLVALRIYLRGNYFVVKTFSDGEQVWQRKEQRVHGALT